MKGKGWILGGLLLCGLLFACQSDPAVDGSGAKEAALATAVPRETPTATVAPSPVPAAKTETASSPRSEAPATSHPTPAQESTSAPITVERLDGGEFDSYFDDAIFVGDSVTKCLSNYVQKTRSKNKSFMGKARFLGTVSMTLWQASRNEPAFDYRGKKIPLTQGLQQTEAKKAFILLGGNDVWRRDWAEVEGLYVDLIQLIRRECPDVQIILQGILPVSENYCRNHSLTIEHWNDFNQVLERVCAEQGVAYYYFGQQLMDENGYLDPALAEGDVHPSDAGDAVWVRALRAYAARQMYPDALVLYPPTEDGDGR